MGKRGKYSLLNDNTVWEDEAAKAIVGLAVLALTLMAALIFGMIKLVQFLT